MKNTLVVGASTNPERYAYKAIVSLLNHGQQVVAYGLKKGNVAGVEIETEWNPTWNVHTVTLYVGTNNQSQAFIDQVIALQPSRVIFNPGTENTTFFQQLTTVGIDCEVACTLVMLATQQY